jgi:hypothetical protein
VKDAAAHRRRDRTATLAADQKQLYRRYCQDDDLYWGTYNDVVRNHRTAVQRIRRRRLDGKLATLRHHRFDGTGTITVQLQRSAAMPPRSPQLLSDPAGRYHNHLVCHGSIRTAGPRCRDPNNAEPAGSPCACAPGALMANRSGSTSPSKPTGGCLRTPR